MKTMKKAYFFDMDGTLYTHKFHTLPSDTIRALVRLKQEGHLVCLATSRTKQELDHLPSAIRNFEFDYQIMDGGALILDHEGKIVFRKPIQQQCMEKMASYCAKHNIPWRYANEEGSWWAIPGNQKMHDILFSLYLTTPSFKGYEKDEVLNALIFSKDEKLLEIARQESVVVYENCIEVRAKQCDKADAVQWVCEKEKADWSCAFGDGANDVQMIRYATVGVAMANGCDQLKEVADEVVESIGNYIQERGEKKECIA